MRKVFLSAALAVAAFVSSANAAGVYTVTPGVLSNDAAGIPNGVVGGNAGFGFDRDKPAPAVTGEGFYAQGNVGDYNSFRFTPTGIGMTGLTLGQITSIAYDHQQDGGGIDWQMKVYTEGSSGWYGVRLNYDLSSNADSAWHNFSDLTTDAERIKPFGAPDIYRVNNAAGFTSALTAAAGQKVLFFDISAGANSGGYPYNTFLNNIVISTNSTQFGSSTIQAVPLPASAFGGLALISLLAARKSRTRLANH